MALQQINLRIEEALLAQFKAAARARGVSANVAAALAFEAWLAGDQSLPSNTKQGELADVVRRLEVLEQKLAKAPPAAPASMPAPAAPPPAAPAPTKPKPTPQIGEGAISTADLAAATNTKRNAWNNWARKNGVGAVRDMGADGSWRYLGKVPSELGGPDRSMWERVLPPD